MGEGNETTVSSVAETHRAALSGKTKDTFLCPPWHQLSPFGALCFAQLLRLIADSLKNRISDFLGKVLGDLLRRRF